MSFAYSAGVITQTGTDADLSGLSGLTGVTHYNNGADGDVYVMDAVGLDVTGTLSIDPKREKIVFLNTCPVQCFKQNGTLTVGSTSTVNGDEVNSYGEWLRILKRGANVFATSETGLILSSSSTTNLYGGTILSNSSVGWDGTVTTTEHTIILNNTSRILPTGGSLSNITLVGGGFKVLGTLSDSPENLTIVNATALGVMVDSTPGPNNLSLDGYRFIGNGKFDVVDDGAKILSKNTEVGTNSVVNHNLAGGGQWQYVEWTKDIKLVLNDTAGSPIQSAKVRLEDNNNGNRINILGANAKDFTADFTLTGATDVNGEFTGNMLLGVDYADGTEPTASTAQDWRNKDNTKGADNFDLKVFNYATVPSSNEIILSGTGVLTTTLVALPDFSITESNKATVDAYTELETPQKFYDRAKADLYDNYAGETATTVTRSGNLIDAGSYDVTIDATAVSAYDLTGNVITIKASTFTGNINTTGTFTLANGAVLDGVLNGQLEVQDGVTYTEDIDGKFVVDTDTVTSFTISGFTPTEIEHIGSGTATILGIENAKVYGPNKVLATNIIATGGTLVIGDGLEPSANYSVASNVITMTGIETDLLGLRGLHEVDYSTVGSITTFSFVGTTLQVDGSMTLNVDSETLEFDEDSGPLELDVRNGGTFTIDGKSTGGGGGDVFDNSTAVFFARIGASTFDGNDACLRVRDGGTYVARGGQVTGHPVVQFDATSTLTFENHIINGLSGNKCTFFTNTITFDGDLIVKQYRTTVKTITLNNYSPQNCATSTGTIDPAGGAPDIILNEFSPINNNVDIGLRYDAQIDVFNSNSGMGLSVNAPFADGSNGQNGGCCRIFKNVGFLIQDASQTPISSAKIFSTAYDDGNRIDVTSFWSSFNGFDYDFTQGQTLDLITDGSGLVSATPVLLKAHHQEPDQNRNVITMRFTQGADDTAGYEFFIIAYDKALSSILTNLNGLEDVQLVGTLVNDLSITESNKATVDAYTELETPQKFYDRAKADLYDNYAGETSTTVTRSGTVIDATGLTITVNGAGATVYDLTGTVITIKASNFTGGFANTTVSHGSNNPTFTDLVLENSTWNADQATWTGSADATSTVDVQATGTYDATGFTFDASTTLNNDTGGAVSIVITNGQQQPTVVNGVGATTNFINAGATLTFSNLTSANVQILEDDGTTVASRQINQTGSYVYSAPNGSSGTWAYCINRAGYDAIVGTFDPIGNDVAIDSTMSQKVLAGGSVAYTGSSSVFVSVVPLADGSRMNIRVANGSVGPTVVFDETEDALQTQDGMSYLMNGGGNVGYDVLGGTSYLFLRTNVRVVRDTAPDINARIEAFTQSTDGVVQDPVNGEVAFITLSTATQLLEYGGFVWIDPVNGTDSAFYPFGTQSNPCRTWGNALALLSSFGLDSVKVNGSLTLDSAGTSIGFYGVGTSASVDVNGQDVDMSYFEELQLTGAVNAATSVRLFKCDMTALTGFVGIADQCRFLDTLSVGAGDASFSYCISAIPGTGRPTVTLTDASTQLDFRNYAGGMNIEGSVAGNATSLDVLSGTVDLKASNTGGDIVVRGDATVVDSSVGATVTDLTLNTRLPTNPASKEDVFGANIAL